MSSDPFSDLIHNSYTILSSFLHPYPTTLTFSGDRGQYPHIPMIGVWYRDFITWNSMGVLRPDKRLSSCKVLRKDKEKGERGVTTPSDTRFNLHYKWHFRKKGGKKKHYLKTLRITWPYVSLDLIGLNPDTQATISSPVISYILLR